MRKFILLSILLNIVLGAAAQTPAAAATPTFKAISRLVLLDVVVIDDKGKFVDGLKKEDFTVLEDGKPQQVTSFEAPDAHPINPISGDQMPVTILLLDELNTPFSDEAYARQQLVRYLKKQPEQLKQPTALIVLNNTQMKVLRNFTRDRNQLLEDVRKHSAGLPWKLQKTVERLTQSLQALQQIAAATTGIPGRKSVIWVGVGFPALNLIGAHEDVKASIENGINRAVNRLKEARITMYPIDPSLMNSMQARASMDTGDDDIGSVEMPADDPFDSDVSLQNLGPATGGRSFHWRNDIDEVIQKSVEDGARYYTLAYVPNNHSDDTKFRSIRLRMRPGLIARTRDGYYPTDAPFTQQQVSLDVQQAALNTLPYTAVPVTLTGRLDRGEVSCTLYINAQALSWQSLPNGDARAEIRVGMASLSKDNTIPSGGYEGIERGFTIPAADFKSLGQKPLLLHVHTRLSQKATRMRFVVRDEATGHMGAVDIDPNHIPAVAELPKMMNGR